MNALSRKAVMFVVSGAGAGYFPRMPGTAGTLVGIPLSLALNHLAASHFALAVSVMAASILCAIWVSTQAAGILGQKDPQVVVIDEVVGFMMGNFLSPPRWPVLLCAFFLFRFFDIVKIFPTGRLERLPGGAGIVLDDVMAGVYTLVSLRLLLMLGWA